MKKFESSLKPDEILVKWESAKIFEPKEKYRVLRDLCNDISRIELEALENTHIDKFIIMLSVAARVVGDPNRFIVIKSKLATLKLKRAGIDVASVRVLTSKKKIISTNSATIGIGDPIFSQEIAGEISEEVIEKGHRFYFATGSDGEFRVSLRTIDLDSPILKLNEYKKLIACTEVSQIQVKSEILFVGQGSSVEKDQCIAVAIDSGWHNLCAYQLLRKDKDFEYLIIVGRATDRMQFSRKPIELLEAL